MRLLKKLPLATLLLLSAMMVVYGCESPESPNEVVPPASEEAGDDHEHADHEHSADADHAHDEADHEHADSEAMTDMEKMEETLASLPPEDRESAMEQHFCPVSGKMLGTMGMPKKIEVEGKTVWICCEGCEDQVRAEPEKYLAKINKTE